MPSPTWTAQRVWAWGAGALGAAAAGSAALVGLVAWSAPALVVWLPFVLVGLAGAVVLARSSEALRLFVVLALGAATFSYEEGLQPLELVYAVLLYGYLAHWYATNLLGGRRMFRRGADVAAALWAAGALVGGALLAQLHGPNTYDFRGDLLSASVFLLYFPVKETVVRARWGPEVVVALLVWLGLFSAVRNAILLHEVLTNATVWWRVFDARISAGEVHLIGALLLSVAALGAVTSRRLRLALIVVVGVLIGGLVITKSRGAWLAAALGLLVAGAMAPGPIRRRGALYLVTGMAGMAAASTALLGNSFNLVVLGLVKRLSMIGSGTAQDLSFMNRLAETRGVWEQIVLNPVLGYGWGVRFSYFTLLERATRTWSFVHNGWLSMWYRLGLWGLGLFLYLWLSGIRGGWTAARAPGAPPLHRAWGAAAAGTLAAYMLMALPSNPFILMDQMTTVTLVLALAHGLRQRLDVPSPDEPAGPAR